MVNPQLQLHLTPQVRGIKGVFLANQKIDGKVTTLITYNKGRNWDPLAPPTTDMNGKPVSCKAVSCDPHLVIDHIYIVCYFIIAMMWY